MSSALPSAKSSTKPTPEATSPTLSTGAPKAYPPLTDEENQRLDDHFMETFRKRISGELPKPL